MGIVAARPANKEAQATAESAERRPMTNGNSQGQSTGRTQSRATVTQAAERIRQFVKREPQEKLTALLHHVTPEALRVALLRTEAGRGPGRGRDDVAGVRDGTGCALARLAPTCTHGSVPSDTGTAGQHRHKPDGGTRPLGVAALEDKIVQKAGVDVILIPIYEEEFLGISYGFRPGRGAHDALDALAYAIERREVNWILDADIRGYFDSISRDWLIRFLEHRIGDRRVLRLIKKWLRAGVLEEGRQIDAGRGTAQGSVISPVLANVYLHYVLDLWVIRKWRPQEARGDVIIVRYADDYVVGFEHRDEAQRFLRELKERFSRFELELNADKTRLIEFSRYAERNRRARGEGRPETFDFLGLKHYCRKDRNGRFGLGRKPVRKRMNRTLKRIKIELRGRWHDDVMDTGRWLGRVLRGWLNYYAVPTSFRYLRQFVWRLRRSWIRGLRRRSQKDRFSWTWLMAISVKLWPKLRIVHPWPTTRFAVNHRR